MTHQQSTDPMTGTWHIVASSLPFWAARSSPAVTYAPLPTGKVLDVLTWSHHGRRRMLIGRDRPTEVGYEWQGLSPLTRRARSRWRFVSSDQTAADPADHWAVTSFDKTLFTPAGVDIYCRVREVSPAAREAAAAVLVTAGLGHHELRDTSA